MLIPSGDSHVKDTLIICVYWTPVYVKAHRCQISMQKGHQSPYFYFVPNQAVWNSLNSCIW